MTAKQAETSVETVELVLHLPDRWRETGRAPWASDYAFRVVRYLGPHTPDAMLGDYALDRLVDGPIAAILRRATTGIRDGLATFLALSCVLDLVRNLLDAARSWAPGALYRLSLHVSLSASTARVEVAGSPDLEGRTFVPVELIGRASVADEPMEDRRSILLTAMLADATSPGRIATQIDRSGAWCVEVELALDAADGARC